MSIRHLAVRFIVDTAQKRCLHQTPWAELAEARSGDGGDGECMDVRARDEWAGCSPLCRLVSLRPSDRHFFALHIGQRIYTMTKAGDYEAVRKDIAALLHQPEYDDGSAGPVLVRLAWYVSGLQLLPDDTLT